MKQYQDLLNHILNNGIDRGDRTGTGTRGVFGYQMRFNLSDGFPLLTSKFTSFRLIKTELLWFLSGDTNEHNLAAMNNNIWNEWATDDGQLGPIYGKQWRSWGPGGIDQIANAIHTIKTNPNSRRIIVSAWNVDDLPDESISPQENVLNGQMALAPCHAFFQFYVVGGKLSCQIYQRSVDTMLGLPFNIASYAALVHMIAQCCGLQVGDLVWVGGDTHIYNNHIEYVSELASREPYPLCDLRLTPWITDIDQFTIDDLMIDNYQHHAGMSLPISV